jgi:hypothetical protein
MKAAINSRTPNFKPELKGFSINNLATTPKNIYVGTKEGALHILDSHYKKTESISSNNSHDSGSFRKVGEWVNSIKSVTIGGQEVVFVGDGSGRVCTSHYMANVFKGARVLWSIRKSLVHLSYAREF